MDSNTDNKAIELISPVQNNKNLTKTSSRVKQDLPKYWDKEYINNRLESIIDNKNKMLIRFLWMSGVRISEALSLHKKDIDFKNYVMRIKWLKNRKYNERIVPIHPKLKDILEMYTAAMNLEDRIFPFTRQRAWQITTLWLDGNPHKLRHSFAVNWLRCNGDLVTLHRILGHSKIQTTMEYLKIVPIDQGKELIKINFD
jgi:integrase